MLDRVDTFNYFSLILSYDYSNWPLVAGNLHKAWRKWGRFSRILVWEGVEPCMPGRLYVAVMKSALMFG